jgi:regulator of replication initiation timing
MAKSAVSVDLQPIDRLEEKIKQLVGMVDALRIERAQAVDEVARLQREMETMRNRLGDAEGASADLTTLREERELIKNRVTQMISQIEKLGL